MYETLHNPTPAERATVLAILYADRLSNYGYDRASWVRITSQRYRAKKALRIAEQRGEIHWEALSHRWQRTPNGVDYTIGQSSNEEFTNEMRRLVNPESPYLS